MITLAIAARPQLGAAQSPSLTVTLQNNLPRVRNTGLLADGKFVGLMRSGFPLRLHYRLELWHERSSWFDQFVREVTWDAVARNDALARIDALAGIEVGGQEPVQEREVGKSGEGGGGCERRGS